MNLNFGNEPFKFGPPPNFIGVSQVPADCRAANTNSDAAAPAPVSLKANAPQAIIIEVIKIKTATSLSSRLQSLQLKARVVPTAFSRARRTDAERAQQL